MAPKRKRGGAGYESDAAMEPAASRKQGGGSSEPDASATYKDMETTLMNLQLSPAFNRKVKGPSSFGILLLINKSALLERGAHSSDEEAIKAVTKVCKDAGLTLHHNAVVSPLDEEHNVVLAFTGTTFQAYYDMLGGLKSKVWLRPQEGKPDVGSFVSAWREGGVVRRVASPGIIGG